MTAKQSHRHVDAERSARLRKNFDLDVGITYTGDDDATSGLLSSLCRALGNVRARVVLIDNASAGDVTVWKQFAENTTVVRNVQPRRPVEVMNQLLEARSAPLVALVDGDAYFDPEEEGIARMVEFMHAHPECAIAGCRWFDARGREMPAERRFPTFSTILRASACELCEPVPDAGVSPTEQSDCLWPSSPLILIRRRALEGRVGFFDDRLGRDTAMADLCLRAKAAGWRVLVNREVVCHRLRFHDSPRSRDETAWQRLRSTMRLLKNRGRNPRQRLPQADIHCNQSTTARLVEQFVGGRAYPEALDDGIYG